MAHPTRKLKQIVFSITLGDVIDFDADLLPSFPITLGRQIKQQSTNIKGTVIIFY